MAFSSRVKQLRLLRMWSNAAVDPAQYACSDVLPALVPARMALDISQGCYCVELAAA